MVAPIDYSLDVATPFQSALQGFQVGSQLAQVQQMNQAREMALARQQQEQDVLRALFNNPNASVEEYSRAAMLLPKERADAVLGAFRAMNEERQGAELRFGGQVFSAFLAQQPEVGQQMLRDRARALAESGDQEKARAYESWADLAQANPEAARSTIGSWLALLPKGADAITAIQNAQKTIREQDLHGPVLRSANAAADEAVARATKEGVLAEFARPTAIANLTKAQSDAHTAAVNARFAERMAQAGLDEKTWNVTNLRSQIGDRSRRLQLDETKVMAEVAEIIQRTASARANIPEWAQKDINKAATDSGAAKVQADRLAELASRMEREAGVAGAARTGIEALKRFTGSQNSYSMMLAQYTQLRNSDVIKNLPPGAASNRDVEIFMQGFPPENANPAALARFLRSMSNVQRATAQIESARADWLGNNRGSLGRAREAFQAGDFRAAPGETFGELSARVWASFNPTANPSGQAANIPNEFSPTRSAPTITPLQSRALDIVNQR